MTTSLSHPLVIYTLDSADIDLMTRWMDEGRMPNLAALWGNSLLFRIGGEAYWDEIGSWVTAYSGIPATHHGYYSARRLKAGTYTMETVPLSAASAEPCWELVQDPNFQALILEPIEGSPSSSTAGKQIYNLTAHQEWYAAMPLQTVPETLSAEVGQIYGPHRRLEFDRLGESLGYYKEQFVANLDVLRRKSELYRELIRRYPAPLVVIGFNDLHDPVHLVWPFFEGRNPHRDPTGELTHAVRTFYEEVDREIGRIQEILPSGATVCLLSMYGIKDQYPTLELAERLMVKLGYQVAANGSAQPRNPLNMARKVIPENLRFEISKRLSSDLQQKLLKDYFAASIDFGKSRAFTLPTALFTSHIRINLKGREPDGLVNPGAEYETLLEEIENEFRKLIDPVTGREAVANFRRTADTYIDGPSQALPDLFVHWHSSKHFLDRVIHPQGEIRQRPPGFFRDSFHRAPGFAAISGPGLSPAPMEDRSILDVAPTLLELLGQTPPDWMLGRSFFKPS